ncbi:MAG TPA: response regulator [Vicinamibacterales bacterium]
MALRTPLVLVAEHHDDTRYMLRELFALHGVQVAECADGDATVAAAFRVRPDVILLDARLPGLDSLTVVRRLRKSTAMHNVRIVFVSDDGRPGDEARARAAGSDHYLLKPVDLDEVLRLVRSSSGSVAFPGRR